MTLFTLARRSLQPGRSVGDNWGMQDAEERRGGDRKAMTLQVQVSDVFGNTREWLGIKLRDLSKGGAFLETSFFWEVNEQLRLKFADHPESWLTARVVRVAKNGSRNGMGVVFTHVPHDTSVALSGWLSRASD